MGLGRCPPKSDTNPLTACAHMYYIHPRLAQSLTLNPKEEPKTQGEHQPRPPRTQRLSPSQRAAHTPPHGSSKRRHLLIPKAPAIPSPASRRWKAQKLVRQALFRGPCRCASHYRMRLSPAPRVPGSRVGLPAPGLPGRSTDPRASKALVPLLFPPSPTSVYYDRCTGTPVMSPVSGPVMCRSRIGICPTQP